MIKARNPNLDILLLAVDRLVELTDEIVFLGGCTTGLLITDPAAPPVRETRDVDVIVEVASYVEYNQLSKKLREKQFREDQSEDAPLCRWVTEDVVLDVMPTDSDILGFTNTWYRDAMNTAVEYELSNEKKIRVVTAPYFLATKIEAFEGRGKGDYLLSHDLEDLVAVIDGRVELIDEINEAEKELKEFLIDKIKSLYNNARFIESLPGKLPGDKASQERLPIIEERIKKIASIKI